MVVFIKIMVSIIIISFLVAVLTCMIGEIFYKHRLENFGNFMLKVTGTEVLVAIVASCVIYILIFMWH